MCIDIEHECECFSMPVLGEPAPEFEAVTTQGTIKLSDYRGKWVVLFSHPADFTPVCTTEFMAFAGIYDELTKMNVQLIGLSIDSVHSHLAWVRNIREKTGVDIPFPVIADLDMNVASLYGMIHTGQSSTAAVRAVFFIDPEGKVRAMIYYPLSNGRYMPEIIRILKAFQTSDEHGVATPANWQPGDKVVVPPPKTQKEAEERLFKGYDCKDFYLCFKEI
ncbi:peroxiredoxin [Methanoplanus sp. FWC-SCC4]|uniref:Peroxiredoxin n=1 Tax=Methanochimaera problematica TaxID=2609417 RepID=A0AA97FBJ2_9EURY|nr:peroxiredoxin [Methanoplanus sp. FWC-SCC4]WOF15228.1 peroxiredoxin [Methanoplanus sp. FWC-SCC4]